MERVTLTIENGVAHVRLNRPEKRNGLDLPMFEAVAQTGQQLVEDRSVRAVVLAGEGPAFCAGLDFKSFMSTPDAKDRLLARIEGLPSNLAQDVAWVWQRVPVPVIAAIHGPCFGGGLQIALGADMRIAAPDARLSVMEIEWGLIPDMGASKTLLPLVRPDVARDLIFTGRIMDGTEAASLGIVTRVSDDPLAAATELATSIAGRSPEAIRGAKRVLVEAPSLSVHDAFGLEAELQGAILGSKNQMEAVMAKMQKRAPKFTDAQ
ncbi:MAG: crotonase/enoyl-CoA hydratase family protein [Myxococcota bacterium]